MKPLIILTASLMSLSASLAAQTPNCAPREAVTQKLTGVGEAQAGIGLAKQGTLIEIWTSDATGTWTVVMTFTNGMSCIMSFGENWIEPVRASYQPDEKLV